MRKLSISIIFLFAIFFSSAQQPLELVARKNRNTHIFSFNSAVKGSFNSNGQIVEFKGRIDSITENSIIVRPYKRSAAERITVPITDLTYIRKKARTGRIVTGALAGGIGLLGVSAIVEDMQERGEFLDGLGATLGGMLMIIGTAPYLIVAASEPVTSREKGYQFAIVRRQ